MAAICQYPPRRRGNYPGCEQPPMRTRWQALRSGDGNHQTGAGGLPGQRYRQADTPASLAPGHNPHQRTTGSQHLSGPGNELRCRPHRFGLLPRQLSSARPRSWRIRLRGLLCPAGAAHGPRTAAATDTGPVTIRAAPAGQDLRGQKHPRAAVCQRRSRARPDRTVPGRMRPTRTRPPLPSNAGSRNQRPEPGAAVRRRARRKCKAWPCPCRPRGHDHSSWRDA